MFVRLYSITGSMLYAMFSGRFDSKPAEDGCYFIDRDGTHFRLILNYLRSGQLVLPEDKILRRELLTEAEFYQIKGIIDEMKVSPYENSSILHVCGASPNLGQLVERHPDKRLSHLLPDISSLS